MKLLGSIFLVVVVALSALTLAVVTNYRLELVYPPSILSWSPALAGLLALGIGLTVLIRRKALTGRNAVMLSVVALLVAVPAGFAVWLYTACALGDCL